MPVMFSYPIEKKRLKKNWKNFLPDKVAAQHCGPGNDFEGGGRGAAPDGGGRGALGQAPWSRGTPCPGLPRSTGGGVGRVD